MDLTKNVVFGEQIKIPEDAQVIWVSDLFVDDYVGGAELTSEALIKSSSFNVFKLHSKNVSMKLLEEGQNCFWIFSNFSQMDLNLIPSIIVNMLYSVVEYDFKFCKWRSPEKHKEVGKEECNCHNEEHGKLIAALYEGAKHLWWMSEKQMDLYHSLFPKLKDKNNTVISSVFDDETLAGIKLLREKYKDTEKTKWIILGSNSWIKGFEDAEQYCKDNKLDYEVVWNLPYDQVLDKLAKSKGMVYLPKGGDTCPRMIIEAKLLGCELVLNDNVLHKDEEWFIPPELCSTCGKKSNKECSNSFHLLEGDDPITQVEQYLYSSKSWFWEGCKSDIEYIPTLSGYTTTRNCIKQQYPYEATIESMLDCCDEVIVMDGGSSDGTWEHLQELAEKEEKLKVFREELDYESKRFALNDGKLKALAREKCTMDYCLQMDSDECIHEEDKDKLKVILNHFPANVDLLCLPVVEPWGSQNKIRMDVNPWKPRLSKNKKNITHGVPGAQRVYEDDGSYYSKGSDGCCYIDKDSLELIQFGTFYVREVEIARQRALQGDEQMKIEYEKWFNQTIENMFSVYHYSWFNIERKIKTYKNYWSRHWESLYNKKMEDTVENNMFFEKKWADVSDEDIKNKAKELEEKTGGHIFHTKYIGQQTPSITINKSHPKYI